MVLLSLALFNPSVFFYPSSCAFRIELHLKYQMASYGSLKSRPPTDFVAMRWMCEMFLLIFQIATVAAVCHGLFGVRARQTPSPATTRANRITNCAQPDVWRHTPGTPTWRLLSRARGNHVNNLSLCTADRLAAAFFSFTAWSPKYITLFSQLPSSHFWFITSWLFYLSQIFDAILDSHSFVSSTEWHFPCALSLTWIVFLWMLTISYTSTSLTQM